MKRIIALLLMLCMLASAAFAEAPAAEPAEAPAAEPAEAPAEELVETAETEEVDPQANMKSMLEGLWQYGLGSLLNSYEAGAQYIIQLLTTTGEQLNAWAVDADARFQEISDGVADTALRLMASANEVTEEVRYITGLDDDTRSLEISGQSLSEVLQNLMSNSNQIAQEVQTRLPDNKDQLIDSATATIGSVADIASSLIYVLTGTADMNAQNRGIPGAETETNEQVANFANTLQFLLQYAAEYLNSLKDTEPVAMEETPAI